jgi:hypothetical protein
LLGGTTLIDSVWKTYNHIDSVWIFSPFDYLLCVCGIVSGLSLLLSTSFPVLPEWRWSTSRTSLLAFLTVSSISLLKIATDAHDVYDVSLSAMIFVSSVLAFSPRLFTFLLTGRMRRFERTTRLRKVLRRLSSYRK